MPERKWIGTWAAAPAPAEGVVGFSDVIMRMNPRISLGGDRLRVRISNAYGNRPLTIGGAHVTALPGTVVRMPAHVPHAVDAPEPSRMILTMLREPKAA